ncbi:FtsX-like permease family protein [Chitinophaga sp. Mgbs1]|uniref:FtsX-like permease family protein n=1 Tax=Chitinophaga solisilvae TaxID=1233460 RepID=A0A433WLQ4_9BACT|nr:FtsX-like permease family protein [Chitinophaga solisilvae]
MIIHYLRTAIRSLLKSRTYSFLNIFGLMIGITCAGVIFLWVEDEWMFDSVHEKKDQLYVVRQHWNYNGSIRTFQSSSALMGPAIQQSIPGVAATCRSTEEPITHLFSYNGHHLYATGAFMDSTAFTMFTFPFVQGTAAQAFTQPYAIVLTEKGARKFFGEEKNVIGKMVQMDNRQTFQVTGIIKDHPDNSSFRFEWVAPFPAYFHQRAWMNSWDANAVSTYVELQPGTDTAAVNREMQAAVKRILPQAIVSPFLFSMNDWRLYNNFENGIQTGGRIAYVRLFGVIGWIIILIACINFMNLATARSEGRSREVGVRKVLGAGRRGLIFQFAGEALLLSAVAMLLAIVAIYLLLPAFNAMVGKHILPDVLKPAHLLAIVMITLICGLTAGSYPSFYLSSFRPIAVLKGRMQQGGGELWIRKGLVITQFTISIVLIISTMVVFQQLQHIRNRNLGYDRHNLIELKAEGAIAKNYEAVRQHLLATGAVENAALSDHETIYGGNNTAAFSWPGKPEQEHVLISHRNVSPDFIKTSGMKIREGRDFMPAAASDSLSVIITHSLAKVISNKSVIGMSFMAPEWDDSVKIYTIVGVAEDFVYGDMYGKPDPVAFFSRTNDPVFMYVRIAAGVGTEEGIRKIRAVIEHDNPDYPFAFKFVDEQFNAMFTNEVLMGRLSRLFATLAVIISCMGLFGLAAYTAERRTKEIGIRKVLGAGIPSIAGLLSGEFLQLVLIAAVVAFPLAWWMMSTWLSQYAYRISVQWWIFLLAGLLAVVIAVLTVSYQAIRVALINPAKSLRSN